MAKDKRFDSTPIPLKQRTIKKLSSPPSQPPPAQDTRKKSGKQLCHRNCHECPAFLTIVEGK